MEVVVILPLLGLLDRVLEQFWYSTHLARVVGKSRTRLKPVDSPNRKADCPKQQKSRIIPCSRGSVIESSLLGPASHSSGDPGQYRIFSLISH